MEYLTVKEAAILVSKSPSSIRRIIYPIIEKNEHPDRDQILPNVADAMAMRMKGETFAWRLSETLLRREIPSDSAGDRASASGSTKHASSSAEAELLSMLRRELDIKNQQIAQQAELINKQVELVGGLSERLREGNVIMASLQQRLALTEGREETTATVIETPPAPTLKNQKGSGTSGKTTKPKKSFWSSMFS